MDEILCSIRDIPKEILICTYALDVDRVAPAVYRLAMGWTVRGSNPDWSEIFRTFSDRPWYHGYRVFPGHKERPERNADPSPFLVP
jgi:hypothetical protein